MEIYYRVVYFCLGVFSSINFATAPGCQEIETTVTSAFDWRLQELDTPTVVEFSVKTPNNKGVYIALNDDTQTRIEGMYQISIGKTANTCEITSPAGSPTSVVTDNACNVIHTSFWLSIDDTTDTISLGKKGVDTPLVTLTDTATGDLTVDDIDSIGLKPTHHLGATWKFSTMGCDIRAVTTISPDQATTTDATTPAKPTSVNPTTVLGSHTTAGTATDATTSANPTSVNPTTVVGSHTTAETTTDGTTSAKQTSVNPTTVVGSHTTVETTAATTATNKQASTKPTTVASNPGSSKACSSPNGCSKKIRDQITNTGLGDSQSKGNRGSMEEMQKLEELNDQLFAALDAVEVNQPLQLTQGDIDIEIVKFDSAAAVDNYKFMPGGSSENQQTTLKIASGSLTEAGPIGIVAYYLASSSQGESDKAEAPNPYETDESSSRSQLASGILSLSAVVNGNKESAKVEFKMDYNTVGIVGDNEQAQVQCGFWNAHESVWSEEGCHVLVVEAADQVTSSCSCYCDHTTNFAILMQLQEIPMNQHSNVLNYLGKVLGGLSIVCLCATVFVYIYLRLMKSLSIKVHTNLCASLALAFIIFITAPGNVAKKSLCQAFAVILHYLFLVAFMWMLVEGYLLYRKTTASVKTPKFIPFFAFAWGVPIVIVAITAGIRFDQYNETSCWISPEKGVIWAFIGPVLFVTSANIMILGIVMRTFMNLKMNTDKSEVDKLKTAFRAVAIMTPILGLPWVFGLLVNFHVAFEYLYGILVATQGIFIFICYCVLNAEVKKAFAIKRGKVSATSTEAISSTKMSTLENRLGDN
ncbi:adhesion G protein-coupled receptor L3-like [Amphiura filiformis]|uniref:adhesion G protein-coupled receptor L3-like n=1 Tax=Amphiura filiformis TaxID=82378 RepID=UPI003B211F63